MSQGPVHLSDLDALVADAIPKAAKHTRALWVFVDLPPVRTRELLGAVAGSDRALVCPYTLQGKHGSMIEMKEPELRTRIMVAFAEHVVSFD